MQPTTAATSRGWNRSTGPAIVPAGRHRQTRITALAVLGAVLLGACGNPPSPSPSAPQSATPSPSAAPSSVPPSASPVEAACASADIGATGGPWGGAAGSRGSDVVVENRGAAGCLLPARPTIALVDQAGTVLLANTPPQSGAGPSLEPGGTIGFSLLIGNWCNQSVTLPLHFSLALADDAVAIGDLAVTTIDDLPPCNGPGQPASLSATEWEPR
jgi:hypothetical protein